MTGRFRLGFSVSFSFLFSLFLCTASIAQERQWPTRPVTIVNVFAAGGSTDVASRAIAQALSARFGQPFVVENRPGAGGMVGSAYVAKTPPDGYTLLNTAIGPAVLNQLLFKSVSYDTDRDFTPIIMVGEVPNVVVSDPKLGMKTLTELVEYGRSNPGKLNIGHAGAGTMGHLAAALIAARTGIQPAYVSYRSPNAVITDVLGGQIQAGVPIYIPAVQSVTALAVTGPARLPFAPSVPTVQESGLDVVAATWSGFLGPAGLPDSIRDELNSAINQFLASEAGKDAMARNNLRIIGGTPQEFTDTMKRDRAKWAPIIAAHNIQLDPQ